MPTLREIRRLTSDKLVPHELATTGVLGPGQTYAGTALGPNRRRLVTSDLASVTALGDDAEDPFDSRKNRWIYLLVAQPEQRRVPEAGFNGAGRADEVVAGYPGAPDEPVAAIDVERPFSMLVPPGVPFEIHAIPPLRGGGSPGLHAAINHAARVILREDTVLVPGPVAAGGVIDATSSFPWMTHPGCFVAATYAGTGSGIESWAIPGATLRFDGERTLLSPRTGVAADGGVPVVVLRPLASWIKAAGASDWAESSVGLVADDDLCLGDADAIALVAAFHAAEAEATVCALGSPEQRFWLAKAEAFAARSPFLRDQRTPRPASTGTAWPGPYAPSGPYGGRWGPSFGAPSKG